MNVTPPARPPKVSNWIFSTQSVSQSRWISNDKTKQKKRKRKGKNDIIVMPCIYIYYKHKHKRKGKEKEKEKMLPLKLVREAISQHPLLVSRCKTHNAKEDQDQDGGGVCKPGFYYSHHLHYYYYYYSSKSSKRKTPNPKRKIRTPLLLFLPTRELISDTFRLATIAREMGLDLYPTPSLSHIIFAYSLPPPPSPSPSSSSSSSAAAALSLSSSFSMPLPHGAVLVSFPCLSSSSLSHLRSFVSLSKGLFKLVFMTAAPHCDDDGIDSRNWDCCSISLFSRLTGDRIESMAAFSRALAGMGWTLFNTTTTGTTSTSSSTINPTAPSSQSVVYLFRKVDSGRVRRTNGECRVRELRLPSLDFRNAPLKILQYVVLMTDDVFYLG